MTDKQIIINGVDVAGCEYLGLYKEYKLKCGCCYPVDCSDNPNCYYKQLIRTNQKLDKIKKVCNKFTPDHYKILLIINNGIVDEEIR